MNLFDFDIDRCVQTLKGGGLILYPTDTVWGIGCDATNEKAVEKIYALKKRHDKKSMIILLADEKDIIHFAKPPSEKVTAYINSADKPVTVIYPQNGKRFSEESYRRRSHDRNTNPEKRIL